MEILIRNLWNKHCFDSYYLSELWSVLGYKDESLGTWLKDFKNHIDHIVKSVSYDTRREKDNTFTQGNWGKVNEVFLQKDVCRSKENQNEWFAIGSLLTLVPEDWTNGLNSPWNLERILTVQNNQVFA